MWKAKKEKSTPRPRYQTSVPGAPAAYFTGPKYIPVISFVRFACQEDSKTRTRATRHYGQWNPFYTQRPWRMGERHGHLVSASRHRGHAHNRTDGMTFSRHSVRVATVCILPEEIGIESSEYHPHIYSIVLRSNTLWVLGRQVLLRSQDGIHWQDAAANLKDEGSFFVSSLVQVADELRIFARNRNGLKCYRWDGWTSGWKPLFLIPVSSPGVFAAFTSGGLVVVAREPSGTQITYRESDLEDCPKWHRTLPGIAIHLQMSSSGHGLCALWGISRSPENLVSSPSAVFSTDDCGLNWKIAATMENMLLAGASTGQNSALVGGSEGILGHVGLDGIKELWKEDGGDIVAIDADGSRQTAVIESDDKTVNQILLFRNGSGEWKRYTAHFFDRVECMRLIGPDECLVCTSHTIFRCCLV
jgi:hypothetical protein